jgi:hypothetical protein
MKTSLTSEIDERIKKRPPSGNKVRTQMSLILIDKRATVI